MNYKNHPKFISVHHQDDGSIDVVVPAAMAQEFLEVWKKGTNCNPDQSSHIRDFSDRLFKRHHIMGVNMKWDLPSEDKFVVETAKQEYQIEQPKTNFYELMRPVVKDQVCTDCSQYAHFRNPACNNPSHPT